MSAAAIPAPSRAKTFLRRLGSTVALWTVILTALFSHNQYISNGVFVLLMGLLAFAGLAEFYGLAEKRGLVCFKGCGLAGGVLAPLTGLLPSSGGAYIAKAFITVITGGAAVITGTLSSSIIFGTINQVVSFGSTPVIGEIAMLAFAVVLLRLMPQGITGRFFRNAP